MRVVRGILPLLLLALLPACGGSGSAASPKPTVLDGSYQYVLLARDPVAGTVNSESGRFEADGFGTMTFAGVYRTLDGVTDGPLAPGTLAYQVTGDHAIAVTGANRTYHGHVDSQGSVGFYAAQQEGSHPSLAIFARRWTTPTVAALRGEWWVMIWSRVAAGADVSLAAIGTLSVDTYGLATTGSYTYNNDGTINPNAVETTSATLEVLPDGSVLLDAGPPEGVLYRGGVSEDRGLVLLGSVGAFEHAGGVCLLVRQGQATGTAALEGAYHAAGFQDAGQVYEGLFGDVTFTGRGGGLWTAEANRDGTVLPALDADLLYAVSEEGIVNLIASGTTHWGGAVGTDGTYALLTGGFTDGSFPSVHVFVK